MDKQLKRKSMSTTNQNFSTKTIEGVEVITYQGKIYIPVQLQQRVVAWSREYLAHPGKSQTEATIRQKCTWPNLCSHVQTFCKTCCTCQLFKKQWKKYGLTTKGSRRTSMVSCKCRLDRTKDHVIWSVAPFEADHKCRPGSCPWSRLWVKSYQHQDFSPGLCVSFSSTGLC